MKTVNLGRKIPEELVNPRGAPAAGPLERHELDMSAVVGQHLLTRCFLRRLGRLLQSRQSIRYSLV